MESPAREGFPSSLNMWSIVFWIERTINQLPSTFWLRMFLSLSFNILMPTRRIAAITRRVILRMTSILNPTGNFLNNQKSLAITPFGMIRLNPEMEIPTDDLPSEKEIDNRTHGKEWPKGDSVFAVGSRCHHEGNAHYGADERTNQDGE